MKTKTDVGCVEMMTPPPQPSSVKHQLIYSVSSTVCQGKINMFTGLESREAGTRLDK